ncbi:MAG: DUF2244 domain-containing protein [Pikeienuella sp.]
MTAIRDNVAGGAGSSAAGGRGASIDWPERGDPPLYRAELWPHRSLRPQDRRLVMLLAAAGFSMPLAASLGSLAFWGLLPFCAMGMAILWTGLAVSSRQGRLTEELTLWRDEIRVERREPSGRVLRWQAFPGFVQTNLRRDGPVPAYLTLSGGGREIELGTFLTATERKSLKGEIEGHLARLR